MLMPIINYFFMIGIPKPDGWFDYIHQRFLVTAIPADRWKQYIQECARVCAPGGWVEIIEMNTQTVDGGPACQQFNTWLVEGLKTRGVDVNMVNNLDEIMREVGLANVTKRTFIGPIGPWGGKAGELFDKCGRLGNSSIQPLLTSALGVPKEEVERVGALAVEEVQTHKAYMEIYVYLGQKQ
jgi:hypothetical protein